MASNLFVRSRPTAQWQASHAYSLGDRIITTSATLWRGVHFECTTAGTSGLVEPVAWGAVGATTVDNTATFTTRGSANTWVAGATYAVGDRVVPTAAKSAVMRNYVYDCTAITTGIAGGTEPVTWVTTTPGTSTTTDGGVTWTCRKCTNWNDANIFIQAVFGDTAGTGKTAAGDTIYVSHTHNGANPAATNITIGGASGFGTATSPLSILCVNDVGDPASPGTAATSAIESTSTTGTIIFTGFFYCYGVTFSAGSGSSSTSIGVTGASANFAWRFEACLLKLNTTANARFIDFGANAQGVNCKIELENTVLQFGAAGQFIRFNGGEFSWHNTASAIAGTAPTTLITVSGVPWHHTATFHSLDLSAITGALLNVSELTQGSVYNFVNCKLGSGFAFTTGTHAGLGGPEVNFINCDSASTNWNYYRETAQGTIQDDVTYILTGGASDGTTPLSWKMVSNANSKLGWPLASAPIVLWNDTTGAKTATVEILSAATLTDADVWVETDYLADTGDPGGLAVSDRVATPVATAANQATSSASWAGGLGGATTQKLNTAFTANKKGAVRARVMLAKASTTVYVDPRITLA